MAQRDAELGEGLNRVYAEKPSLHVADCDPAGFYWLEVDRADISVFAWVRQAPGGEGPIMVISNFTPQHRHGMRLGVPQSGEWKVLLNSDDTMFGGAGCDLPTTLQSEPTACSGQENSVVIELPGHTTMFLTQAG